MNISTKQKISACTEKLVITLFLCVLPFYYLIPSVTIRIEAPGKEKETNAPAQFTPLFPQTLHLVQGFVKAVLFDQFIMGAPFQDVALFKHDDLIGLPDSA